MRWESVQKDNRLYWGNEEAEFVYPDAVFPGPPTRLFQMSLPCSPFPLLRLFLNPTTSAALAATTETGSTTVAPESPSATEVILYFESPTL